MKTKILMYAFIGGLTLSSFSLNAKADSLVPGDSFFFGRYEQNNNDKGKEGIEWIVQEVKEDRALLISKYALDYVEFHSEKSDEVNWSNSSLRTWLNQEFIEEAFSQEEQDAILSTPILNSGDQGNEIWTIRDLQDTEDKIFLLSYREAVTYFESNKERKLKETAYSSAKGDPFRQISNVAIKEAGWWTRSPGASDGQECFVDNDGSIKSKKINEMSTIRPALWLDLSADQSNFSHDLYITAQSTMENEAFKEAGDLFELIGDYEDSELKKSECLFQYASQLAEEANYTEAISVYESLNNYKDSDLLCRECRYKYAVMTQEAEDYEMAAELFGKAGQYEDSMVRMRECFEKLGNPIYFFSENAVNTGMDNGYSKANELKGDDRHFGWRLGRFFMNGFTRVSDGTSDNPVFIKTLGDSVTLWFDLEQNIDALNGKKTLSVIKDTNGYDQYFNIPKTNFGRGTLIVQHTNYQNLKDDPVIYTDYLQAKGTSGADTKVILNEEGDYEVALDYELQDNDILHVNSKYGNYKIRFRFSVRNGNCMVYPFDILSGAELQNTSVTENGFYLDLARSRYLDIDVKRSVIIESPDGSIIEDERFNRPAKDGDQYTDEGIYTISVSNLYTGESIVKTIFVGSEELLQEYVEMGFSLDRLK